MFVRRILLPLATLTLSLLLCEAALRLVASAVPRVDYLLEPPWSRRSPPDSTLGHRVSPFAPGMDDRGYRNPVALEGADVLALGDSYTFGVPAASAESWPAVLAEKLGRPVYNAGIIGYGFCEYPLVLASLASLEPGVVVLGVYTGNDLGDTYRAVYLEGRCGTLRSTDASVLEALAAADARGTIAAQAAALGWNWFPEASSLRTRPRVLDWAAEHLRLYGLLRQVRHRLRRRRPITFASAADFPGREAWDARPEIRTVFKHPDMLALTVDLEDPRIREGLRAGLRSLEGMRESVRAAGARLLVVLIPDKATVYAPVIAATSSPAGAQLQRLARLDTEVRRALSDGLDSLGIVYLDATPALETALREGIAVYPEGDDHHNSAAGYRVIAETIASSSVFH